MLIATRHQVFEANGDRPKPLIEDARILALSCEAQTTAIVTESDLIVNWESTGSDIPSDVEAVDILDDGSIFVGTEGPHLYRYVSGGLELVESFESLECREDFWTPWGGPAAIRSFAHTPDGWLYADVHVGSIIRSEDRGKSWAPVTPDLHEDVHQVATHSRETDLVVANTADAVYVSEDRGSSWNHRSEGLPYRYGRAVAIHPENPECFIASVSRGPHSNVEGRLYRSEDAGRSWEHIEDGFPASTTNNIDTFQIAFSEDGRAWSSVDSDLYVSEDGGICWSVGWTAPEPITLLAG